MRKVASLRGRGRLYLPAKREAKASDDLHHTAATLLLAGGIHPRVVQERLGHSTISVTMDIYSHVMPTMQREDAEHLDRALAVR